LEHGNRTCSYDGRRFLLTNVASAAGGSFTHHYDEVNRVDSTTWNAPAVGGSPQRSYQTSYQYDRDGCLRQITYPTGTVVAMTCDTANRTKTVRVGSIPIVEDATYEPGGQVASLVLGNGRSSSFAYDGRSRLRSSTTTGVVGLAYEYDGDDDVVSLCRDPGNAACASSPPPSALTRRMTYDLAGRLMSVVAPGQWGTLVYDYDALGNRTLKSGAITTSFAYGEDNRLVSAEGPEVFTPMTFTWSQAGNLASSSDGVTYRYDGAGRRAVKSSGTQTVLYHYDAAGRILSETLADGRRLRDYVYLGSRLVAVEGCITTDAPPCTEREWYHGDGLGSTVARTGGGGAVQASLDYQPWGEQWAVAGAQGDRQYNGRVYDPGTGFHDYGARLYWPQVGRFVSADSYRGDIASPASLNRYSYVLNNPYKYIDPDGRTPRGAAVGASVGATVGVVIGFLLGGGGGTGVAVATGGVGVLAIPAGAMEGAALGGLAGTASGAAVGSWISDLLTMQATASSSGSTVLGAKGTQVTSQTVWGGAGSGAARIDVENPNPGQRPGQIHYQEGKEKYIYDTVAKVFKDAPKRVNELLKSPEVQKGIDKAMKILGETKCE
jgi:RHS repeat-associated protein